MTRRPSAARRKNFSGIVRFPGKCRPRSSSSFEAVGQTPISSASQEERLMKLDGKTILITGSTDGVGRVVALRLAGAGAEVLVHGRDTARGESLLAEMRAQGNDKGRFYRADLASLAETRGLAET